MRKPWTPSIVPDETPDTIYLVADIFPDGPLVRESILGRTDRETVLSDLATGQYRDPQHVMAFNLREGWSRLVSGEIADEIRRWADLAGHDLPPSVLDFIERHSRPERQLSLRLAASR